MFSRVINDDKESAKCPPINYRLRHQGNLPGWTGTGASISSAARARDPVAAIAQAFPITTLRQPALRQAADHQRRAATASNQAMARR